MNPLDLISAQFEHFTKNEEVIAAYILNNPKDFARASIDLCVQSIGTSKAAMIRFAKKLGYNGYVELKFDLSRFLFTTSFSDDQQPSGNNIEQIIRQYCDSIEQLNMTVNHAVLVAMAQRIVNARKVKVYAINRTALGARQLQMRCLKIGIDVDVVEDKTMMFDTSAIVCPEDYVIIFTIKDNGKVYGAQLEIMKERQVPTAIVTMNPQLPHCRVCDEVILLPSVSKKYGSFSDEQAIYFIFVEILLNELAKTRNDYSVTKSLQHHLKP